MKKEKLTYSQQKAQKWIDTLLERHKKGEVIEFNEIETLLRISPIIADCVNDLDMRIRKLERAMGKKKE
jgi:hypothetical protein